MNDSIIENSCPYCEHPMSTTRMSCNQCNVSIEADFPDQPLSRLPVEHQRFIEIFVLAGGSLKEIAKQAGVSYPTVRNRLDKVMQQLAEESAAEQKKGKRDKNANQQSVNQILKAI